MALPGQLSRRGEAINFPPDAPARDSGRRLPAGVVLAGVVALATGLRIWGGVHHPFVQDELYTLIDARLLLESPLDPGIGARPLYYLLQHILLPVLPETEPGLRVLPMVFGVAGVWATWALARAVFDRRAAAGASLLAAIAPWHLYISEMARYWSLVYLLLCLFLLARVRIEEGGSVELWGWTGLGSLVLGTLTHPTFLFPVVGVFVLDAWRVVRESDEGVWWSRPMVRRVWLPYAAFGALALCVYVLTGETSSVQQRSSRGLGPTMRLLPAVVQWITPALAMGAAVASLGFMLSDRARWRHWGRLAVFAGVSTLGLLMAAAFVSTVYTDYAVGVLPLTFVSLGGLLSVLDRSAVRRASFLQLSVVVLMISAVLPSTVSHVIDGTRFDLRPAFEFIRETDPDIPVYVDPIAMQRRYGDDLQGRPLAEAEPSELESAVTDTDFWVVAPFRRYGLIHDPDGEVQGWLTSHCPERLSYERPRFDFRMYQVRVFRCGPDRGT